MASFGEGTVIDVVMTDIVEPSCMTARLTMMGGESHEVPIEVVEDVPPLPGSPLEVREVLPFGAVHARRIYRVLLPSARAAGVYDLVFVDHCLGTTQFVRTVGVGGLDVYGRSGDVVAMFGDYKASLVAMGLPELTLAESLNTLDAALAARVELGRDLGGTVAAPRALGLQGRAVQNVAPGDGARLVWSSSNNRWEPQVP